MTIICRQTTDYNALNQACMRGRFVFCMCLTEVHTVILGVPKVYGLGLKFDMGVVKVTSCAIQKCF